MFEVIKLIIEDIALLISVLFLLFLVYQSIKFYQDTHYNINFFPIFFGKFYRKHYYLVLLIPFIFIFNRYYYQLIYILCIIGIYLLMSKRKKILKLRFTPRIIRLYAFIVITWTILGTLLMYKISFPHLLSLLAFLAFFSPILVFLAAILMAPIEKLIAKGYHYVAKKKMRKFSPTVIGITGSCGKTSVKNYLYELLKNNFLVFKSPKSYNTLNGISMTINDYLTTQNSYFILEMGATKVGNIEKLINFVHPQYCIITEIVPQHLQTFKTIDNIILEKMKLVENLPSDGVAFLNYDNHYIRNYNVKNNCKIITYGTTKDCDYYALNIQMTLSGLKFDVFYADQKYKVETKLLGRHNVNNLLAAIAVSLYFQIDAQEIIDSIYQLSPVPHRLNIRRENNITILDDAYNSNINGFKNALEVLNLSHDYKVLLTPGIVELGKETKRINSILAKEIVKVCDEVILINNFAIKSLYQELKKLGYKNVRVVNSFNEGYAFINKGIVLIENDLTDNYFI